MRTYRSAVSLAVTIALTATVGPTLCRHSYAADDRTNLKLTFGVCNYAKVQDNVLRPAIVVAADIFRSAGVESEWIVREAEPDRPVLLNVRIQPGGSRNPGSPDAFGSAWLTGTNEPSNLADVFYGQVEGRAFMGPRVSMLLANAMAHEVGHLLLGAQHSNDGIMRGQWVGLQIKMAQTGPLRFSESEARRVRAAAAARSGLTAVDVRH